MKKLWRYDNHYLTLEYVDVEEKYALVRTWMWPLIGDGEYIYLETLEEAKEVVMEDIQEQMRNLQETLDNILKM